MNLAMAIQTAGMPFVLNRVSRELSLRVPVTRGSKSSYPFTFAVGAGQIALHRSSFPFFQVTYSAV